MTTPAKSAERRRIGCRCWSVACLVIMLAGCASQPGRNGVVAADGTAVESGEGQGAVINGKLARLLSEAQSQATISVAESPWGREVRVTARPPYFAASGRECRLLDIVSRSTGTEQKAVACATRSGWIAHRPVTHVLSNGSEP